MKVKIFDKIYDGEKQPVMVILTDQDKKNIRDMLPECTKYCMYPDTISVKKIKEWMKTEENEKEEYLTKIAPDEVADALQKIRDGDVEGIDAEKELLNTPLDLSKFDKKVVEGAIEEFEQAVKIVIENESDEVKMKVNKNNIQYGQDLQGFRNIPQGLYTITKRDLKIRLTAPGYGELGNYGNGSLYVSMKHLPKKIQRMIKLKVK